MAWGDAGRLPVWRLSVRALYSGPWDDVMVGSSWRGRMWDSLGEVGHRASRGYYFQRWSIGVQHIYKELLGLHVCGVREACVAICMGVTRDMHE